MTQHTLVRFEPVVQTKPPVTGGLLQRKCACGKHTTDQHGECTECRKKRTRLQRWAINRDDPSTAPSIVHEVLSSPGRSLDASTPTFVESHFDHDFSS